MIYYILTVNMIVHIVKMMLIKGASYEKKYKKRICSLASAMLLVSSMSVAVAAAKSFGNDLNGASNKEVLQVKYDGAAWNYSGSGYDWASFKYTRNGKTLMSKCVYSGKVTGSVWDDLIHWGDKYTTYFNWNNG